MGENADALIKEILKSNNAAMELLVKENYNMVHSFVYRFIGDYNMAYDITQEVFIKMMKNLKRYKFENCNFKSWLLKIAANTCKDYFKSSTYKQRISSSDIDDMNIKDDKNVIDILEKNEKIQNVKNAVMNLPENQREAVILKYYHDLKIREIANITGQNENTVKSRLFNAIKNLKKVIGGEDNEKRHVR